MSEMSGINRDLGKIVKVFFLFLLATANGCKSLTLGKYDIGDPSHKHPNKGM